jgi:alkylhydroperoxidase family enzyme
MARMRIVRRQNDCAGSREEAQQLFDLLFPQGGERVLRGGQQGWGLVAAHGPRTALLVAQLTKQIAAGPFLTARPDLREIAIQSVNLHFRCDFSYHSHLAYLSKVGLPLETIAALPYWRTSSVFDADQKLVIAYTLALVAGDVSDALHAEAVNELGEGAVAELAFAVAHWSFWAIFLNAARLDIDAVTP